MKRFKYLFIVPLIFSLIITSCKSKKAVVKDNKADDKVSVVSTKLNLSEKEVKKNPLYSFVSEWYGAPYKYGGCSKWGVDCSCFTGLLYQKVYGTSIERNASSIYKECKRVKQSKLKEGDFVFFKIGSKSVSHVGVYLKDNKFVHASTSRGVIINDLNEDYYRKHFYEGGKLK